MRGPHEIEALVILRALLCLFEQFGGILVTAFFQSDVTQAGARSSTKASRLAELGDNRQRATAGIERILKMLLRGWQIVSGERDASHAQFVGHVNDRDPIFVQLLLRFQQTNRTTSRRGDFNSSG